MRNKLFSNYDMEKNIKDFIDKKISDLKTDLEQLISEKKEIKKENKNSLINLDEFSKIVIYQFGKVGSSSLKETFKTLGFRTIHSHVWKNEFLFHSEGRSLIINIVRKIPDRNISALFQNIKEKKERNFYFKYKLNDFEKLSTHFEKAHNNEMSWMKNYYRSFENQCGISIFDKEFDINKPYLYFPKAKCNSAVLILRFEDINEWEDIFIELFGIKINLIDSNRTEEKDIYPIYKNFKENYKFKNEDLDKIWDIDFMQFFYPIDYLEYLENKQNNI